MLFHVVKPFLKSDGVIESKLFFSRAEVFQVLYALHYVILMEIVSYQTGSYYEQHVYSPIASECV